MSDHPSSQRQDTLKWQTFTQIVGNFRAASSREYCTEDDNGAVTFADVVTVVDSGSTVLRTDSSSYIPLSLEKRFHFLTTFPTKEERRRIASAAANGSERSAAMGDGSPW